MNSKVLSKKLFYYFLELLPHNARYDVNKSLRKKNYINSQNLRKKHTTGNDSSLKGFDELKCIFVHVPKAAGLSVNMALFGNAGGVHKSIFHYSLIFNKSEFNSYYKFTFVRNPWDRLLSAYLFLKEGGLHKNDANWAENELAVFNNFDEFVKNWVNQNNIEKEIHFKPQYKFITIKGKILIDNVYKVENINEEFPKICAKLNIQNNLQVLNRTKTKIKNYRNYYDEETIKVVEKVYKKDIELFKYRF